MSPKPVSGSTDRTRSMLAAAQIAVATLLVVVGGQVLGGFTALLNADRGFDTDGLVASVILPEGARRGQTYSAILEAVRALPGVESAGTVSALPFSGENHSGFVAIDETRVPAEIDVVSPEYLQTLRARLIEGRWFHAEEANTANDVALVSEYLAGRLWPGANALGRRLCVHCTPENPNNWKRVVGVVSSIRHAALDEPRQGDVYLAAGAMDRAQFLVVRTARPTGEMAAAIRRAVASVDPDLPVFLAASMSSLIADSVADRRFVLSLLTALGCLALLMSAAGVYGVVSYTTSRRTQEFGIRMALGATAADVHQLVFRQGLATVVFGLAVGFTGAQLAMPLLRHSLAGLETGTATHSAMSAGLVAAAAALACWIPARRAVRIDPVPALRTDG